MDGLPRRIVHQTQGAAGRETNGDRADGDRLFDGGWLLSSYFETVSLESHIHGTTDDERGPEPTQASTLVGEVSALMAAA
jgi:hypothetical protein